MKRWFSAAFTSLAKEKQMTQTDAVPPKAQAMTDTKGSKPARRTFSDALAALIADPKTTYRLRQLIQDDEVLRRGSSLSDEDLLARLDVLVRDDAATIGARDVPPGPVLHTAQERAEAFVQANAINALEGYQASDEDLALQRRVVDGELTSDQAVQEIIRRAKDRRGA